MRWWNVCTSDQKHERLVHNFTVQIMLALYMIHLINILPEIVGKLVNSNENLV